MLVHAECAYPVRLLQAPAGIQPVPDPGDAALLELREHVAVLGQAHGVRNDGGHQDGEAAAPSVRDHAGGQRGPPGPDELGVREARVPAAGERDDGVADHVPGGRAPRVEVRHGFPIGSEPLEEVEQGQGAHAAPGQGADLRVPRLGASASPGGENLLDAAALRLERRPLLREHPNDEEERHGLHERGHEHPHRIHQQPVLLGECRVAEGDRLGEKADGARQQRQRQRATHGGERVARPDLFCLGVGAQPRRLLQCRPAHHRDGPEGDG
mmetsp:Transcript_34519/g.103148  ORF Transcript_34519/g.103148 Transcript_34519/m.103148 type:complete len:269 (-) Transcript_34519:518-1324(-)